MSDNAHDLEFTVLESLVLQDALDGSIFSRRRQLRLEDDTKRAVSNDFTLRVLQVPSFSSDAILNLFTDHFSHPQAIERIWSVSRHVEGDVSKSRRVRYWCGRQDA